jgi:hypothetical protein
LSDHNTIKLELNNKRSRKYTNNWRLNNTLLNDQCVIEEIREEIKKFLEFNEKENTTYQNLWDTEKAVLLRRRFRAVSTHIKNIERSQINDLMLHLKILEKQEQAKPKRSRREIIKICTKINQIETKTAIQRIKETKSWYFEKLNKIDKPLGNLTKRRREKTQINKIRNKKGEIIKNIKEIQQIIRDYFENLHSNKLENLE